MIRQFDNKGHSLTVTDKQVAGGKLFDWSKKFTGHMFNTKLEETSNKMSFRTLPVKIQRLTTPYPPPHADKVNLIQYPLQTQTSSCLYHFSNLLKKIASHPCPCFLPGKRSTGDERAPDCNKFVREQIW